MKNFKDKLASLHPASYAVLGLIIVAVIIILLFVRKGEVVPSEREPDRKEVRGKSVKPEPEVSKKGKIAIIIDDFGYNYNGVTKSFLDLDSKLTFAVIPGHHYSRKFAEDASAAGYEVIIHMPMETMNGLRGEDGYILKTEMTGDEIERRVKLAIENFPTAKGMNNHQGSRACQDSRLMTITGTILKNNSLYFIDSRTSPETVGEKVMKSLGVPVNRRDIFLDNDADPELIRTQLGKLTRLAEKRGLAIGIGHGRPATLEVLRDELPRLEAEGFEFIFASEVVR